MTWVPRGLHKKKVTKSQKYLGTNGPVDGGGGPPKQIWPISQKYPLILVTYGSKSTRPRGIHCINVWLKNTKWRNKWVGCFSFMDMFCNVWEKWGGRVSAGRFRFFQHLFLNFFLTLTLLLSQKIVNLTYLQYQKHCIFVGLPLQVPSVTASICTLKKLRGRNCIIFYSI